VRGTHFEGADLTGATMPEGRPASPDRPKVKRDWSEDKPKNDWVEKPKNEDTAPPDVPSPLS
jgi:hypothetical protein